MFYYTKKFNTELTKAKLTSFMESYNLMRLIKSQICVKDKNFMHICGVLRDLVPFVQFKKREKHPWRSVTFSKVAGTHLILIILLQRHL